MVLTYLHFRILEISQWIGEVLVASQVQHPLAAPAPENRGHAQTRGHGAMVWQAASFYA